MQVLARSVASKILAVFLFLLLSMCGMAQTLNGLSFSPSSIMGGDSTTGMVTLTANAPAGGVAVSLLSSNTMYVTVQNSVTVPAGQSSATFQVTPGIYYTMYTCTITASLGSVSKQAILTVLPLLKSLSLLPASVVEGSSTTGTITLNGTAPTGGITVALSSNTTYVTVPSSVTVPAGNTIATFTATTGAYYEQFTGTVTASVGADNLRAPLTVSLLSAYRQTFPLLPATEPGLASIGINDNDDNNSTVDLSFGNVAAYSSIGSRYVRVGGQLHSTGVFNAGTAQSLYTALNQAQPITPICVLAPNGNLGSLLSGSGANTTVNVTETQNYAQQIALAITSEYSVTTTSGAQVYWCPSHTGVIWELFNEPYNAGVNAGAFVTAPQYCEILEILFDTIRQTATVGSTGLYTYDEWFIGIDASPALASFAQQCIAYGACGPLAGTGIPTGSRLLDGIAVHPYTQYPSTQDSFFNLLEGWLAMYTPLSASHPKGSNAVPVLAPLIPTEYGFTTPDLQNPGDSAPVPNADTELDKAAMSLAQTFYGFELANPTSPGNTGISGITLFCSQNYPSVPGETTGGTGNFGAYETTNGNGLGGASLTTTGTSLQNITQTDMPGAVFSKRLFLPPYSATNQFTGGSVPTSGVRVVEEFFGS